MYFVDFIFFLKILLFVKLNYIKNVIKVKFGCILKGYLYFLVVMMIYILIYLILISIIILLL